MFSSDVIEIVPSFYCGRIAGELHMNWSGDRDTDKFALASFLPSRIKGPLKNMYPKPNSDPVTITGKYPKT